MPVLFLTAVRGCRKNQAALVGAATCGAGGAAGWSIGRKQYEGTQSLEEGSGTRVDWRRFALRRSCLFNCAGSETTSTAATATATSASATTAATASAQTATAATAATTTGAEG